MNRRPFVLIAAVCLPLLLAGCDLLGLEPASAIAARKEAEGKAIGGACRHAGRAIEDCYALNKKADKSAVFNGWREMNDYMRENKIETVKPELVPNPAAPKPATADGEEEDAHTSEAKPAKGEKEPAKAAPKKATAKH